ncbi:RagB/SusD family nutrient uptake outer membrane protein [Chitinophaga sp.]|uniref:RagB/SusD family nutrient uptake outer membrane protein n=1 Tax=Chitinophaga sp. TaxID=1869181 RepID=UPI002F95CBF6
MLYLNNKKIIHGLLLMVLLSATACKKLIEIDPPIDTVSTTTVFNDPVKANSALAAIYYTLMSNGGSPSFSSGSMTVYGGMMADELFPYAGASNPLDYQFYTNKLLLDNILAPAPFWVTAYKAVYSANSVLAGVAASTSLAMTDSVKRQLNGESRFARAFCFFYLTNLYGEIPLPLSASPVAEATQKRQPLDKVNQQITDDLNAAIQLLPDNFSVTKGTKVRPNKYAAIALLARHYLYQKKWKEAAEQADIVINSGQFGLTSLAETFGASSRESIWQLKFSGNGVATYMPETIALTPQLSLSMLDQATQEMFLDPDQFVTFSYMVIPFYIMSDHLVNAFEPGDQRKDKWTDSMHTPAAAPWNGVEYRFVRKYVRLTADGQDAPPYYTVMRLAEQYLIRAEARAQLNDIGGAAADINLLRSRAGLHDTKAASQQDMLDAIAHERQIELFAEWGHRWFDLKRSGKAAQVLGAIAEKQPWTDDKLLLFVPPDEIKNDPALTQNPGYFW